MPNILVGLMNLWHIRGGFLRGSDGKGSACNAETWVRSLSWEDPLEEGWQPTPVFLPVESPQLEEPGKLQSMGLQRVGHEWLSTAEQLEIFLELATALLWHCSPGWVLPFSQIHVSSFNFFVCFCLQRARELSEFLSCILPREFSWPCGSNSSPHACSLGANH